MPVVVNVYSYFSLETDLAGEMHDWPEFVSGEEYSVNLKDNSTGEEVVVRFIAPKDGEHPRVKITSNTAETLFDRVVGRVIWSMSAHSDNLMVDRHDID